MTITMEELLTSLPEAPAPAEILTDGEADAAIRAIMKLEAEKTRILRIADDEISAMKQRRDSVADEFDRKADWHRKRLETYFDTDIPKTTTKTQESYRLFSGRLIRKARQPEYIRDETAILRWLVANELGDFAVADWRVKWDALKKAVIPEGESAIYQPTGEVIDGIKVVARPPVFEVKED
jgi:phage host-nuclease inhibitor protein Gam